MNCIMVRRIIHKRENVANIWNYVRIAKTKRLVKLVPTQNLGAVYL